MANQDGLHVRGLPELVKKLDDPDWTRTPMQRFFQRWAFKVEAGAKRKMDKSKKGWNWTGQSRRSITSEVDDRDPNLPEFARVGSNVPQVRWGEFGTGLLSEDPQSKKQRHFPPPAALERWVRSKRPRGKPQPGQDEGALLTAYGVARIIGLRGGIKPRRFLRDSVDESLSSVPRYMGLLARELEAEASKDEYGH